MTKKAPRQPARHPGLAAEAVRAIAAEFERASKVDPLPLPDDEDVAFRVRQEREDEFFSQFDEFGFLKNGYLK